MDDLTMPGVSTGNGPRALRAAAGCALALLLAACAAAPTPPSAAAPPTRGALHLRLIAINDLHGNLEPPAPITVRDAQGASQPRLVAAGGIARLATAIAAEREGARHSIVVAAGDLVSASPLVSSLFYDEPTIEALNALGLDVTSVGNHEFDRGRTELRRLIDGGCRPGGCVGEPKYGGAHFAYLAANVRDEATGKPFLPAYAIREFEGLPVAFIGLVLTQTPAMVSRSGIAGLRFEDEADAVNALVPELRARGVESIVVLIHQGATTSGSYNDPGCPEMAGDIVAIVKRFDRAVDAVVSAHTHQAYLCHVDGRLVTSAGSYGRFLTRIDLTIDRTTRDVTAATADNVLIDPARYAPEPKVAALVARYAALAAPRSGRVVGYVAAPVSQTALPSGESALGNLIADAQLEASRGAGAQIAFMNPGGVRAPLLSQRADRGVTFGDIYSIQPFGNNLVTVTLTGAEIRRVLEQQFRKDAAGDQRNRVMFVSHGFTYQWDAAAPPGRRIVEGSVRLDGFPLDAARDYRVAMNGFLADGGDGYSAFRSGRDRQGGMLDIEALEAYLGAHSPVEAVDIGRITRLN